MTHREARRLTGSRTRRRSGTKTSVIVASAGCKKPPKYRNHHTGFLPLPKVEVARRVRKALKVVEAVV